MIKLRTGAAKSAAWRQLATSAKAMRKRHLRELIFSDKDRFERFSAEIDGSLLDYSRQRMDQNILGQLIALAHSADLPQWIDQLFSGATVNETEQRAAFHMGLRNPPGKAVLVGNKNVMPAVFEDRDRMRAFVDQLHNGQMPGGNRESVRHVINIGIGGSDLGVRMATGALSKFRSGRVESHFVSNADGSELADVMARVSPNQALFIVCSKSFSTPETLLNATTARDWLTSGTGRADAIKTHFAGVSANTEAMSRFGIADDMQFRMPEWVGGRYSVWSAAGLSLACAIGMDNFELFLKGAHVLDEHFRSAPFENNLPVLLGLIAVWNINFLGSEFHAVLPYDSKLREFPRYLQQLEMESTGKSVSRDGAALDIKTSNLVFGEPGSNAQHSFGQLLHQGTRQFSADFLYSIHDATLSPEHEKLTLANCMAQVSALALGVTRDELIDQTGNPHLGAHRAVPGNRPCSVILIDRLDPESLGCLIALYEHKVFVQAMIWGINPFDQWGVELGKRIADQISVPDQGEPIAPDNLGLAGILKAIARRRH